MERLGKPRHRRSSSARVADEFPGTETHQWTRDMKLRQPVYLGLREDKDPRDVVREGQRARASTRIIWIQRFLDSARNDKMLANVSGLRTPARLRSLLSTLEFEQKFYLEILESDTLSICQFPDLLAREKN